MLWECSLTSCRKYSDTQPQHPITAQPQKEGARRADFGARRKKSAPGQVLIEKLAVLSLLTWVTKEDQTLCFVFFKGTLGFLRREPVSRPGYSDETADIYGPTVRRFSGCFVREAEVPEYHWTGKPINAKRYRRPTILHLAVSDDSGIDLRQILCHKAVLLSLLHAQFGMGESIAALT